MPIPLTRSSPTARNRWFDDYTKLVLERDVRELSRLRQREQLPALLRRLAAQTAGVLNVTSAANQAGVERTTAADYLKLLEAVFLIMRLPAWGTTLRARATRAPKIHVVDAGVAARLLRLTPEKLAQRDASSLSQFGHLLETFVVGEIVRQASWLEKVTTVGHWRTSDGDEIDLVLEREGWRHRRVRRQGRQSGRGERHAPFAQAARHPRGTVPGRRDAIHWHPRIRPGRPPPRDPHRPAVGPDIAGFAAIRHSERSDLERVLEVRDRHTLALV
jgi:predicted AAA+ superfamily ATPase